jgi:glycosyltransferase involved in cell wall biosynthesis
MLKSSLVNMCVSIPRYDSDRYPAECLDSVLMQDFDGRGILISDDCTTGNTLKAMKTYSAFPCP